MMSNQITRRSLLAVSAGFTMASMFAKGSAAAPAAFQLRATRRTLEIQGRAATVWGLENGQGKQGLTLDPGQRFAVDLTNDLDVQTLIHWHGQIPPNRQDGVPDAPLPGLMPGESRSYDFVPSPGTHWMHSHIPVQEMQLLAAPLIIRRPEDLTADRQEIVMFLHDFSFRPAEDILAEITTGAAHHDMTEMDHGADPMAAATDHSGHGMAAPAMDHAGHNMAQMSGMAGMADMMGDASAMAMDLNDVNFDAYLANDRTLDDPEVIAVEKAGRVLLRVINAASATTFWIDGGGLNMALVAVDGQPVHPVAGTRFGLSMGQRLDLEIDLPKGTGAWPILALREGARERAGLMLATQGAMIPRLAVQGDATAPAFDLDLHQEASLRARHPLPASAAVTPRMVMLGGTMQPYRWTIDGRVWDDRLPLQARTGQRLEMTFHNQSMMGHPMHLHGHHFQVVGINDRRFSGALRDTVYVPPMARVTVAVDPGEVARWMLHCHHMPHLSTGMMTEFVVSA